MCSALPIFAASGASINLTDATGPTLGNASFACTDGNWGAALTGATCAYPVPVARFTVSNSNPLTGQEVIFDPGSSSSTTINGSAVTFTWDFAGGSESAVQAATPLKIVRWASAGAKVVSLTITDVGGSHTLTQTVTVASSATTGLLNDTGLDWCSENITNGSWLNNAVCSALTWGTSLWGTAQDAYFGRDAQARAGTLAKTGAGMAGFDFTKLGTSGKPLAVQGNAWSDTGTEAASTQWDCVRDHTTGLIWEVKRNDVTHLRDKAKTYTWYNATSTSNGGNTGSVNAPGCTDSASNPCNTSSYAAAVNALPAAQTLCGFRDWRLPTQDELSSLTHLGRSNPAIDTDVFPHTDALPFWTATPAYTPANATYVHFQYGQTDASTVVTKTTPYRVRLVR